ncbi:MAG: transcription-repair coupling factor [Chloroflexi bacterium]|nr:transcription-repair coupling factor [Chloroflexota bacterium]
MDLGALLELIRREERYQAFVAGLRVRAGQSAADGAPCAAGLLDAARPYVVAALSRDWPGPIVVVSGSPEEVRQFGDQFDAWSPQAQRALQFAAPDALFYDRTTWDRETTHARVAVFSALLESARREKADGAHPVIVTSMWALMTKTASPLAMRRAQRRLTTGEMLPPNELLMYCVRAGYEPVAVVEDPGTFSRRGSIIDLYPPNQPQPVRIDFFGDEIDSIRAFDAATQRSADALPELQLIPATEALPEWGKAAAGALAALDLQSCDAATRHRMTEQIEALAQGQHLAGSEYYLPYLFPRGYTLLDHLPPNALVLLDDYLRLESAAEALHNQALSLRAEMISAGQLPEGFAVPYLEWAQTRTRLRERGAVDLGHGLAETGLYATQEGFVAAPQYGGRFQDALEDLGELRRKGQRTVVVTRQGERLADLLRDENLYVTPVSELAEVPEEGSVTLVDGILAQGFAYVPGRMMVLTDAEVFGWSRPRKRRPVRRRAASPESLYGDLKEGDYVVHVDYGIGRYHGVVRKTLANLTRDYLEIEFEAGDRLYVPIHQADRVSRYVGADDRTPYIHRLGGHEWQSLRERAEESARDIAAELLELYAAREVTQGHAFATDTPWQHDLEMSFPYEETDDQLSALADVKADMERAKPMDRLLCGDVGYGKTEVALRAAFKAVMDGKQAAVLVPTTVLAQQHFYTFRRRLRAFPVTVEMLSRFRTPEEQEAVIQGLMSGAVDIVIGTHRLLSQDVTFKDLGLLIIDEEQRFGVTHKERLKQLRREVDVLTLTATPIPRTLYLALSGARDMSVIDTPPENRLPVQTFVAEYEESLIRKTILRELDRGGQVYYVHNRVQDIYAVAEMLRRVVPEATLVVGHGQMDEDELSQVMLGFAQGEADVLLCTTIIESGLDITNVNTIVIDRAEMMGLSQLYQLRGRVGRGTNRAYALLMYKPPLTEIALKRLETIQEATELGAGFRVAMRDMEIRGAGEILGDQQHGHITAIGFDLYCRLLQQAVQELREDSGEPMMAIHRAQYKVALNNAALGFGPSIDLPISAYLPADLIADSALRLRFYRRMARIDTAQDVDDLAHELEDRFGKLPESVSDLLYLLRVRALATDAGVESVNADSEEIAIALPMPVLPEAAASLAALAQGLRARGTRVWVKLQGDWRKTLLMVLRRIGELAPVAQGARR